MEFGKTKLELRLGFFVLTGFVILIVFVLLIGDFKTWGVGYKVKFNFNFVNGVKIGAPVRYAGVDVGEVNNIDFVFIPDEKKTRISVTAWIRKDIAIPSDSTVWVNTLGLLGEKYIEIMPGVDYGNCIKEGQILEGKTPPAMHEIADLAKNIASELEALIGKIEKGEGTIGRLINDDSLYDEMYFMLKNKEGTVGRLFYDDTLYTEIRELILDIKRHPWKLFWKTKEKPIKK